MADVLGKGSEKTNACEGLSFSKIQKLKYADLQTCKVAIRKDLKECKANTNVVKRHTVRGGDTLAQILGRDLYYNKHIYIKGPKAKKFIRDNKENPYPLQLGDILKIIGNECSKKITITITKDPILKIAMEVGNRIKNLPKQDLRVAKKSIPHISGGIFSYSEIMALAAKESRMSPNIHNGLTRFNAEYRPTDNERKTYGARSKQKGVLRDLEDATIHLVKYYKAIERIAKNPKNKVMRMTIRNKKITIKELALTAYNRGYNRVLQLLMKGKDPRIAELPRSHRYYAREILVLSKNPQFNKDLQ